MKRSEDRILTTHAGCLQRPPELVEAMRNGTPEQVATELDKAVSDVVRQQVKTGLDIVNDGEFGKAIWHWYIFDRIEGFDHEPFDAPYFKGRDRENFRDFYEWADATPHVLFYGQDEFWIGSLTHQPVCKAPVAYQPEPVRRDLSSLSSALDAVDATEAFYPVVAPASIEVGVRNEYYTTDEELLWALAEAMKEEYNLVAEAGFIVQVDDAWIPALWDREPDLDLETYRRYCRSRIEALNYALADIPEERIRYHICWGSWHGPHAFDIPLADVVDLMLEVKSNAYLVEAANVRHEHEYHVWEDVKLPEGKILIPGVVTHSTNLIETPQLVAERIQRFAKLIGKENVIAGTDCGMGARIHPQLGWAKLQALSEGAELASRELY